MHERVKGKQQKASNTQAYQDKLLAKCKTWDGPCTSVEELEDTLSKHPDNVEVLVKTELSFYKHCHRSDVMARPELYKINGKTHCERLENFTILSSESESRTDVGDPHTYLPSNSDVFEMLVPNDNDSRQEPERDYIAINEMYVTLWEENGIKRWYIGYCTERGPSKIVVDHLHRNRKNADTLWRYPLIPDTTDVSEDQILAVQLEGQWDVRSTRNMAFKISNIAEIRKAINALGK